MKTTDGDFETDENIFKLNQQKFKISGKRNYHFLTRAGAKFQKSVYKLCRRMIKEESFPRDFSSTVLFQLWKRKGSRGKQSFYNS